MKKSEFAALYISLLFVSLSPVVILLLLAEEGDRIDCLRRHPGVLFPAACLLAVFVGAILLFGLGPRMISEFRTLKRHEAIGAALVVSVIIATPLIYDLAVTEAGDRLGYLKRDPELLFFLAPLCISLAVALAFAGVRFISLITGIRKAEFMSPIRDLKKQQKVAILLGLIIVVVSLLPLVVVRSPKLLQFFALELGSSRRQMIGPYLFICPIFCISLAALMIFLSFLRDRE